MILYKFNQDSFYSSVEKHNVSNELGKELLSGCYSSDYFKTFSQAKKALNKYLKQQLSEWKYAIESCKQLTESTVNDYTK